MHDWGFDARRDGDLVRYTKSDEHQRVLLFVIHGCLENESLEEAVKSAFEENQDALEEVDLSTVWLFHHSLKDKQPSVENAVKEAVNGRATLGLSCITRRDGLP